MTLWSTYWTARSTRTRDTPSSSNCMNAIVPVASWVNAWSTRSEISSPARSSPSARCSARICRVRFSAKVLPIQGSPGAAAVDGLAGLVGRLRASIVRQAALGPFLGLEDRHRDDDRHGYQRGADQVGQVVSGVERRRLSRAVGEQGSGPLGGEGREHGES